MIISKYCPFSLSFSYFVSCQRQTVRQKLVYQIKVYYLNRIVRFCHSLIKITSLAMSKELDFKTEFIEIYSYLANHKLQSKIISLNLFELMIFFLSTIKD